jgi:hypothetical protein
VNREGTLHIVWLNRGQPEPQYSIGFADYTSSGGAMKTITVNGDKALGDFLLSIGINQRISDSVFEGLRSDGQASVLRVVLPDQMLRQLGLQGPPRTAKEKVEAAIDILKRQGHAVQAIIRENGTMWFEIDRKMLTSWDEMINLADGVYTLEVLIELYKVRQAQEKRVFAVRFTVFFELGGPILAYSLAGAFMPGTFTSRAGAKYPDVGALIKALDSMGLPGYEIANSQVPTKTFTVTGAQLLELGLKIPER